MNDVKERCLFITAKLLLVKSIEQENRQNVINNSLFNSNI